MATNETLSTNTVRMNNDYDSGDDEDDDDADAGADVDADANDALDGDDECCNFKLRLSYAQMRK